MIHINMLIDDVILGVNNGRYFATITGYQWTSWRWIWKHGNRSNSSRSIKEKYYF